MYSTIARQAAARVGRARGVGELALERGEERFGSAGSFRSALVRPPSWLIPACAVWAWPLA